MTCACTGKVLAVPTPCPVHWPEGVVKLMEAGAAKANAKGVPMLSHEQLEAVEKVIDAIPHPAVADKYANGWFNAIAAVLGAVRNNLVMKVEVAPTATATGTIEGLDGLGRRVGEG